MFTIAWGAREGDRNMRQSHLDFLPRFPPRLADQGESGEAPPRASFDVLLQVEEGTLVAAGGLSGGER